MSLFLRADSKVDPAVLAKSITNLPALPELATRVLALAKDVDSSPLELLRTISKDPSLASAILKSVNSAAYGLPRRVDSLDRAIPMLGLKAVANLTVAQSVASLFKNAKLGKHFTSSDLWDHCNAVALVARRLGQVSGREFAEVAFLTGLIHDIGLVVLCQKHSATMNSIIDISEFDTSTSLAQNERSAFGFDHADLGMYIAEHWKLPEATCFAVGYHHDALKCPESGRKLAAIVAIADMLCCESKEGLWVTATGQSPTPELLAAAGVGPDVIEKIRTDIKSLVSEARVNQAA